MVGCVTQAALDKRKQKERKQLKEGQCQENVQENVRQELRDKSKELRVNNLESEQEKEKKRKRFTPPTVDEVREYCLKRKNGVDPQRFVDHYEARGWKYNGNVAMKDWQAAVRTWEKNMKGEKDLDYWTK